jgi:putative membrane protein
MDLDIKNLARNAALTLGMAAFITAGAAAQTNDQTSATPGASNPGSSATQESPASEGHQHSGSAADKASSGSSQLSAMDKHFVRKAAQGGLAEVELGKLATQKASSDDVKKFGQRMVDDHTKANDQLKQLAQQKGIDLPTQPDAKDKATMDRLQKLSGDQFDKAYMQTMVKDHTKDVSEFQKASQSAKDPDVKNFAAQTLPTLQDHLKEAKNIAPKENKQASAKPSPAGNDVK